MNRRRFLAISAAALAAGPAHAAPLRQIRGQALGAVVTLTLGHPEAERIAARALDEIARLERIFSLYRDSDLTRLNATGALVAPPFELLDCLALCGRVHAATGGLFDPTVQPLWALHAETAGRPTPAARAGALKRTDWLGASIDETGIRLRPGMALTLNGVAQGYIADRVAALLAAEGLTDILVDTGELRALGGHPEGGDWPVTLGGGRVPLRDLALASSSPHGTAFDAAGRVGHILDPRSGLPAPARWHLIGVSSRSAALADALSTAFCLMTRPGIDRTLRRFPEATLVHLA